MEFSTPLILLSQYREPGSNRHSHHWPKDFKSFVSTYSTIAAVEIYQNRVQRYCFFLEYARKQHNFMKFIVKFVYVKKMLYLCSLNCVRAEMCAS